MADIIPLFEGKLSVEEAIKQASEAPWGDVIVFGYDDEGKFQLYSSRMDNNQALMMAKILESKIMEPIIHGEVL